MIVWMEISKDKYQLPLAIANSARELSKITGASVNRIECAASRMARGKSKTSRVVKVMIEED